MWLAWQADTAVNGGRRATGAAHKVPARRALTARMLRFNPNGMSFTPLDAPAFLHARGQVAKDAAAPARPSWPEYFMQFAQLARARATCIRRQVGAVIVKNNMVLTTGYNGAPRGLAHASEVGCLRNQMGVPSGQRHELCRGLHAEQNAMVQAARHGISIDGAELYCTTHPCVICLKMILNAGIVAVYYLEGYADDIARAIIAESQFPVVQIDAHGQPVVAQAAVTAPADAAQREPTVASARLPIVGATHVDG